MTIKKSNKTIFKKIKPNFYEKNSRNCVIVYQVGLKDTKNILLSILLFVYSSKASRIKISCLN